MFAKNKRSINNDPNRLPFVLLGDPAIRLAVAQTHFTSIDSVNGKDVKVGIDTIGALSRIVLEGSIRSLNDSIIDETFDITVNVNGGGFSGQTGAIRLGITRALLVYDQGNEENEDSYRKVLKANGFVTRDPRVKERKKYGLKKARKAPQFRKR